MFLDLNSEHQSSTLDSEPHHPSIYDIIERVSNVSTQNELWDKVYDFVKGFGALNFTYYHIPPLGAYDSSLPYVTFRGAETPDPGQYEAILRKRAQNMMPILRTLETPTSFATLSELVESDSTLSELGINLRIDESVNGVIIPVHSPNGRSGAVVIGLNDESLSHTRKQIRHIQWVCETAHRNFCLLRLPHSRKMKALSKREKEVMKWVAAGKSNTVIAEIIGISHHTVNGYLRSIYLKTGTSDRTTATLRCVSESLFEF